MMHKWLDSSPFTDGPHDPSEHSSGASTLAAVPSRWLGTIGAQLRLAARSMMETQIVGYLLSCPAAAAGAPLADRRETAYLRSWRLWYRANT
jgi:hypothetical protein